MLLAPPDRLAPVEQAGRQKYEKTCRIVSADPHLIQISHRDAGKGVALRRVATDHYGVDMARTMAALDRNLARAERRDVSALFVERDPVRVAELGAIREAIRLAVRAEAPDRVRPRRGEVGVHSRIGGVEGAVPVHRDVVQVSLNERLTPQAGAAASQQRLAVNPEW